MEEQFLSLLDKGIYVEKKFYDKRGIVVFDDNYLDTKYVNYEKLLQHLIENITTALNLSDRNKVSGSFVLFILLNPNRKHYINKKSLVHMITILNSLYKKNLYFIIQINILKLFSVQ